MNEALKVLLLAGGRGKRLEENSEQMNKCMLAVESKPTIEYNLERASELPIEEIIIIVGYRAEDIINHYGISFNGKRIRYVLQLEQKGLVHAIECSREAIGGDDIFLMLGDELLINSKHKEMYSFFHRQNIFGCCGVLLEEDKRRISRTYNIIQNGNQQIFRLIEKPENPLNNIMGTGNCIFKNEIFEYIEQTPINQKRGEKELPDLIQSSIDDGKIVKSFAICDSYFNINSIRDLTEAEAYLKSKKSGA